MKKTIIALMALAGIASAASIGYDEMTDEQKTGVVYSAWTDVTASSSNQPWTNIENTGADFTLSFDISDIVSCSAEKTLLSAAGANSQQSYEDGFLQLWVNANGSLTLNNTCGGNDTTKYFDGSTRGNATVSNYTLDIGISATNTSGDPNTVTFVSNSTDKTFTAYVNGEQVGQWTNWNTDTGITGMQLGKCYGNGRDIDGTVHFENVVLWNRALNASEVSALVVPEPTTATLSLLALAGLAARRRRK